MPAPLSSTLSTAPPAARRQRSVTRPPAGVKRRALAARLSSSWRRRSGSPRTTGAPPSPSAVQVEDQPDGPGQGLDLPVHGHQELLQVHGLVGERRRLVGAGQRQEVGQQGGEARRPLRQLLQQRSHGGVAGARPAAGCMAGPLAGGAWGDRVQLLAQQRQLRAQGGDGGAQLVGGVGQEAALRGQGGVQPGVQVADAGAVRQDPPREPDRWREEEEGPRRRADEHGEQGPGGEEAGLRRPVRAGDAPPGRRPARPPPGGGHGGDAARVDQEVDQRPGHRRQGDGRRQVRAGGRGGRRRPGDGEGALGDVEQGDGPRPPGEGLGGGHGGRRRRGRPTPAGRAAPGRGPGRWPR